VQTLHFSESDLPVIGERDWPTLTILAHELGHHMNNHLTNPLPDATRRGMELEADETAGFLLYLMGGGLEQGKLAFREASETGSYTHPPRAQRHEALARGYADAVKRFPRNRGGGPDPVRPDPVSPNRVNFASVTIGSQVWMADNLNVDRFRNGDIIPEARTAEEWRRANDNKQPAWCYYDNNPANGAMYGKLYNWYAVNDPRGLAPAGWHIPMDAEWSRLFDRLGGMSQAGPRLKSTMGWKNGGNGDNSSGFAGLPSGFRGLSARFNDIGAAGFWWISTGNAHGLAWDRYQFRSDDYLNTDGNFKGVGCSVRCLKD
jgi:uncharacterized protein (TIGR02145 family)